MTEYLTSPVTLIVLGVVSAAAVIAIVTTIVSNQRKEREREALAAAARAERARQIEAARQRLLAESRPKPRTPKPWDLPRRRKPSVPAKGRPGFRTDAPSRRSEDSTYDPYPAIATAFLLNESTRDNSPSPSHDPSPSPSPSYDPSPSPSPSYDSGSSSSSSDSGGSFGGGDSGSF